MRAPAGPVLEGSVRRAGDRVRVTAQLIDAERGFHVWSETYDRRLDEVFAVQEEIARAIATALQLRLPAATTRAHFAGGTRDAEAYNEYLLGLHYWNQRTAEDTHRAIQHLDRAIELNPSYATAYTWYGNMLRAQGRMHEALEYSARAVERDPLAVQLLINHAINLAVAGRAQEARARRSTRRSESTSARSTSSSGHSDSLPMCSTCPPSRRCGGTLASGS
jgi:adenylate cyclase